MAVGTNQATTPPHLLFWIWLRERAIREGGVMLIDTSLPVHDLPQAAAMAKELEAAGYDGAFTAETAHDPFFPHVAAALNTERITLGTSIAIAFARNPMILANIGNDLQAASEGRFILGLGSQIKPHITKRFSMEWSKPAARMRELILAIRAIWDTWENGTRLDFRGDFYTHTLMTPAFSPRPNPHGNPRIFLAGVGPLMTEVAGETCDGFFTHPFTTADYMRDVTLPALASGREKGGRSADGFEVALPAFIVTGENDEQMAKADSAVRKQIAFYGSTPAYRPVLDHHDLGDIQTELNRRSKLGEWDEMAELVTDEILEVFAVIGSPNEIAAGLQQRFGDLAQRISFNTRGVVPDAVLADVAAELRTA